MRTRNGFVLLLTCLALILLMAIAGIAVDVGRMHIGRNELQSFAESAATSAALQLDGSAGGIEHAIETVKQTAAGPNALKWDMATKEVTATTTFFGKALASNRDQPDPSSWAENVTAAADYRFVKVVASAEVESFFLRAFQAVKDGTSKVVAVGVAGQVSSPENAEAAVTFSATAANLLPPNFGFKEGEHYSIRYQPTDAGSVNDEAATTLVTRAREDSDAVSANYASYNGNAKGNGRRVVALPVNNGDGAKFTSVGYAQFFLLTPDQYNAAHNSDPLFAEYVGPAQSGSLNRTTVRLIR